MLSFEFLLRLSAILKLDFLKSPGKCGSASPPRGMKLGNCSQLSDYNPTHVKNKAVNTPIKFEEIVYGYDKSSNEVIYNHSTSLS